LLFQVKASAQRALTMSWRMLLAVGIRADR
jgi:hypothetical protein